MFTRSMASAETDKEPSPEADRITIATLLHGLSTVYQKMLTLVVGAENRGHRPLDPGPQHEPDFGDELRKIEGRLGQLEDRPRTVYYGNHHSPPERDPDKYQRKIVWDLLFKVAFWVITAAVGFAYGRLWDHEHRISVIEGREVPNARSP